MGLKMKALKHHVIRHKKKIIFGAPVIVMLLVLDMSGYVAPEKTSLSLIPETARFVTADTSIAATVRLTARTPVNAVGGTIRLEPSAANILDTSQKNTVISLWAEEPTFVQEKGVISFQGGILSEGGFVGEGTVLKLFIKPTSTGVLPLTLENVQVLAHDGKGTDVQAEIHNTTFVVRAPNTPTPDLNGDDAVTFSDVSIFLMKWPLSRNVSAYDFNGDGKITFSDINPLVAALGK